MDKIEKDKSVAIVTVFCSCLRWVGGRITQEGRFGQIFFFSFSKGI